MFPSIGQLFRPTQQVTVTNPPNQPTQTGAGPQPGTATGPGGSQQTGGNQSAPGSTMQQRQGTQQPGGPQPGSTMQPAGTGGAEGGDSPLAAFRDLWKTPENGGANQPTDPFAEPLFSTDPAKIKEAASQMDFISQVNPELLQKAMSGNDPQAFMQVINGVAQQALATALQVTTGTVEQAGSKIGKRVSDMLPSRIRDHQINSQQSANPILNDPAVQPMLKMARQQIKMMNPDMTPEQVQKEAERYLTTMAESMMGSDPERVQQQQANTQREQNWMDWAN